MITLQAKLAFSRDEDKKAVLDLMRRWSACARYAYRRLLEGKEPKELRKLLPGLFRLNARYASDAVLWALCLLRACRGRGQSPKKVVFGGRRLWEKLARRHLAGRRWQEVRREWRERRQGNLFSRGEKGAQGNLNLRLVETDGELYLRVNVGTRTYVYAKVLRRVTRKRDKWPDFRLSLERAKATGAYFPYSVRLRVRKGEVYVMISYEERLPHVEVTKQNGVIGCDVNADPFHLALAEVRPDGNLVEYWRESLEELLRAHREKREYLEWQVAHRVTDSARAKGRAVALEDLRSLPRGRRGDGMPKLRRRLQKWVYRRLLEKIETLARRKGIEVVRVDPAYTTLTGSLKYAPMVRVDKDVAGAFVVGRRALGFRERLPRNYKKLLGEPEFWSYALARAEDKVEALRKRLREEGNAYRRSALRRRLSELKAERERLWKGWLHSSGGSEQAAREPVDRGKERVRGRKDVRLQSLQVLSVAFGVLLLGGSFRDFSPLRRVLVSGDWERALSRRAPAPGAGAAVRARPP